VSATALTRDRYALGAVLPAHARFLPGARVTLPTAVAKAFN
jgi:hypothetical protein